MQFIAEELREYMAKLGVRTVDELVGRTDLLKVKEYADHPWRAEDWIWMRILYNPYAEGRRSQRL